MNEYISKKNEINNFEMNNRDNDDLFQNFMEQLEDIKNSEDEKVIDWLHQEVFNQHKVIEATLLIDCVDKFLRLEKIISNVKKDISNLNLEKNEKYFIELIQYFYDFYDKLSKNNIIKDSNRLIKTIIRNINEEDNKFEVLNDEGVKIQQKFNYNTGDDLKVTQTETIEVEKSKEFKHEREIKLKEKKFDLLEER
ncbi:hypothetical protein JOC47_003002 [Halanaerobacter jeridensis]|uniref:Uncharacterized protein n=1 Tax=Halanaerobacter jeridensis TaxID=706427 RepID=A0A938XR86_9FIRM|nr:hypothetical protein [Halanaerobacter jeridensis]